MPHVLELAAKFPRRKPQTYTKGQRHQMPTLDLKPTVWKLLHVLLPKAKLSWYSMLIAFIGFSYFDHTFTQKNQDVPACNWGKTVILYAKQDTELGIETSFSSKLKKK